MTKSRRGFVRIVGNAEVMAGTAAMPIQLPDSPAVTGQLPISQLLEKILVT